MGGSSRYGGEEMMTVRSDVILVTVNYRLGALGWLGGKAVANSTSDGSSGNFGLQDTREALRWVQRNIQALGGDAGRVTIFGESAGASMVASHLVAPRSAGLFSGAIMQSGSFDNETMQIDPDANFWQFAKDAGCSNPQGSGDLALECLRRLPVDDISPWDQALMKAIAKTNMDMIFSPTVDGVELSASTQYLASKGRLNPVQGVILGTNANESRLLMPLTEPVPGAPQSSEQQLKDWLRKQFEDDVVEDAVKLYLAEDTPDFDGSRYWRAAAEIYTDTNYLCPAQRSARWLAESGKVPADRVFVYEFNYEPSFVDKASEWFYWWEWCHTIGPCKNDLVPLGAAHGVEVLLVFAYAQYLNATDQQLSRRMVNWWQNFAVAHDPNNRSGERGLPVWPAYVAANRTLMLQPQLETVRNLRQDYCSFWDTVNLHLSFEFGKVANPAMHFGGPFVKTAEHASGMESRPRFLV
eukprot:TRINITY_DN23768_c0_g1_i1.p1 TRINITY_DN23768_c0_g1~~TRINITY_DN23768_c0_g1_i1.p1  ORF type:complete len:468 (+),score=62.06 TRINITY_DN23768_c0_g1_i1:433-1836(+)